MALHTPTTPAELEQRIRTFWSESGLSDRDVIGPFLQLQDVDHDYLQARDSYAWYHAIAAILRPRVIAEIGVRFGYSLRAMALGAGMRATLIGYDSEQYPGAGDCLRRATANFRQTLNPFVLFKVNTRDVPALYMGGVDLFHVDGDHNYGGALDDLQKVLPCLARGEGDLPAILVDDIEFVAEVKRAADEFCRWGRFDYFDLPTFRGLRVILPRTGRS